MATVIDIRKLSLEKQSKIYEITGRKEPLINISRITTEKLKKLKDVFSSGDDVKIIKQEDKNEKAINTLRQLLKEQKEKRDK